MSKKLTNLNKFKILSEFCNDVAKGLMIAGILGQTIIISNDLYIKVIVSVIVIVSSLIFLYFSVLLSNKYGKYSKL